MKLKHFIVILFVILLPVVFSFISPQFADNLRNFSYSLSKPILQVSQSLARVGREVYFRVHEYHRLYGENKRLEKELGDLRKQIVDQKELEAENKRLKQLFEFKEQVNTQAVAARVIARDISYWSRWIVLDKGIEDGVIPGMVLVSNQGLVGRIVSAGKHIARGILIIDGESRVSVIIQPSRDTGLLEGRGDDPLVITLLDIDAAVKAGDAVITSGLGGAYPKGIPVGKIQTVSVDKDGLHKNAVLKPFADLSKLEEILCLNTSVPS
jgi:rod shape-determining protein MreC